MEKAMGLISRWKLVIVVAVVMFAVFATCKTGGDATETTAGTAAKKYYTTITVEEGDSLWSIAQEYMTEEYHTTEEYIEEVMFTNNLKSDVIVTGTHLLVPFYEVVGYDE